MYDLENGLENIEVDIERAAALLNILFRDGYEEVYTPETWEGELLCREMQEHAELIFCIQERIEEALTDVSGVKDELQTMLKESTDGAA